MMTTFCLCMCLGSVFGSVMGTFTGTDADATIGERGEPSYGHKCVSTMTHLDCSGRERPLVCRGIPCGLNRNVCTTEA